MFFNVDLFSMCSSSINISNIDKIVRNVLFGYSNGVFFENKVEVVNDTQNEHFLQ
jgi:hypothetical protein